MNKSFLWASVCLCCASFSMSANATTYIYSYTGGNYSNFGGILYDNTMKLSGHLALSAPLGPNLELSEINPTSYTLDTGAFEISQSSNLETSTFKISTDATGEIIQWFIELKESQPTPLSIGASYNGLTTTTFLDQVKTYEVIGYSELSGWLITLTDEALSSPYQGDWEINVIPDIDIKPSKKSENVLNPRKDKNLKVAIIGDETFDATQVNIETVRFGVTGTETGPLNYRGIDYNRDGYADLILTFKTSDTGIGCEHVEATLTAETYPDPIYAIRGTDNFTVNCK